MLGADELQVDVFWRAAVYQSSWVGGFARRVDPSGSVNSAPKTWFQLPAFLLNFTAILIHFGAQLMSNTIGRRGQYAHLILWSSSGNCWTLVEFSIVRKYLKVLQKHMNVELKVKNFCFGTNCTWIKLLGLKLGFVNKYPFPAESSFFDVV
jgi:hypothetical protein